MMLNVKKGLVCIALCHAFVSIEAQGEMKAVEGYSPQIGLMVYMLEDLKIRITDQVKDLDQSDTDFLYDESANSIGSLIMHLVSTEAYYQVQTLEGRPWTEEERSRLGMAGELNEETKNILKGKPIQHYLDLWHEVRQKSLKGLKSKNDKWFLSQIADGINNQYVWYHVMEHSANHMGQIATIMNRLPK